MTRVFRRYPAWQPGLDARDPTFLEDLLEEAQAPPSAGCLLALVSIRRGGKTWSLRALEERCRAAGRPVVFTDLRGRAELPDPPAGTLHLLEEPGELLADPARTVSFRDQVRAQAERGVRLTAALTPLELAQLTALDPLGQVCDRKAVRVLPRPSSAEIERLASRSPAAAAWLPSIPRRWRSSLCLLELLLHCHERDPDRDVTDIVQEASSSRVNKITRGSCIATACPLSSSSCWSPSRRARRRSPTITT